MATKYVFTNATSGQLRYTVSNPEVRSPSNGLLASGDVYGMVSGLTSKVSGVVSGYPWYQFGVWPDPPAELITATFAGNTEVVLELMVLPIDPASE
jgi:hypothetical protein